jgi:oligopeptide transport system substrate-binding protein
MRLAKVPELGVMHTTFNMDDPIIGKNKYLRQAISLAHDANHELQLFYNGQGMVAQGPIPPGLSGYDPAMKNPYTQYNVEKAKQLLAKAGYPGGKGLPPLDMPTLSDSTSRQQAELFEKEMNAIGVQLKVDPGSWPQFQDAVKNKKGQLWSWVWGADYPDAEDFLMLFYSKNVSPGANDANYRNPEIDKLYEKSLTLPDGPQRTAVYQQMVKILVEDAPWLFDIHRMIVAVVHPWMKNYKYTDAGHDGAKYYGIDPSLKK